jgi:autophagy-related protein 2
VTLKQLCSKKRLVGLNELFEFVQKEWLDDVRTQMTGILGGVGPMHSLRQIGQGIYDLFWLPIQQYKKDGRVVRGLQKGTSSFGTSTAMAAVELTNRLVQTIQGAAEMTYDFLSPAYQAERRQIRAEQKRRYGRQPVDVREGVTRAYDVVTQGFTDTATAISQVAMQEHEQYGLTAAVTGILKVTPGTAVQPIILATEAVSNVLGGVRNQFVPDAKREQEDKYRAEQA